MGTTSKKNAQLQLMLLMLNAFSSHV